MSFTESSHRDAKNRTNTPDGSQKNSQYEQVMCFGTFDLFHPGHVYYLSEAEKLAKTMTIIVARDARVSGIKGRPPKHDEDTRLHNVAHAFRDARVILGDEKDIFLPLRAFKPDILAF
jgi:FAD synthetase